MQKTDPEMEKIIGLLEDIKEEFDRPITDLYTAAVILCMATSISGNCNNCPVVLFDCDKRTRHEKCNLHEPCQTNLYKWLIAEAKKDEK